MPLIGTGAGGGDQIKGALVDALLATLTRAAQDHDVDIALVTWTPKRFLLPSMLGDEIPRRTGPRCRLRGAPMRLG
jgi:hypothetical protein